MWSIPRNSVKNLSFLPYNCPATISTNRQTAKPRFRVASLCSIRPAANNQPNQPGKIGKNGLLNSKWKFSDTWSNTTILTALKSVTLRSTNARRRRGVPTSTWLTENDVTFTLFLEKASTCIETPLNRVGSKEPEKSFPKQRVDTWERFKWLQIHQAGPNLEFTYREEVPLLDTWAIVFFSKFEDSGRKFIEETGKTIDEFLGTAKQRITIFSLFEGTNPARANPRKDQSLEFEPWH